MVENHVDFVIVAPLEEERDALLALLPGVVQLGKEEQDVHTYYRATVPTRRDGGGAYQIILTCLTQMGPLQAAAQTAWVASRWRPRGVLVVGIAGGVAAADVNLGDVLVADQVVDYTVGKLEVIDGRSQRRVRWEAHRTDRLLFDSALNLGFAWIARVQKPRPRPGRPKRHKGIVASGGDVVQDPEFIVRFRDPWDKLIGVEMEGGGAATALHASNDRPRFLMIRGVSDLADPDKNEPATKLWRPYACAVAAAYAIELLRSGPLVPIEHQERRGPAVGPVPAPSDPARERDVRTLRSFFEQVDLRTIDHFVDLGLSGAIPASSLYYGEGVDGFVHQSTFHIVDPVLRKLVVSFAQSLAGAIRFGEYFEVDERGGEYKFMNPGRVPLEVHRKLDAARAAFRTSVEETRGSLQALLGHVKDRWPEIDLEATSSTARAERREFERKFREEVEFPHDAADEMPAETVDGAMKAILQRAQVAAVAYVAGSDEQEITLQLESPVELEAARRLSLDGRARLDGTRCMVVVRRQI